MIVNILIPENIAVVTSLIHILQNEIICTVHITCVEFLAAHRLPFKDADKHLLVSKFFQIYV